MAWYWWLLVSLVALYCIAGATAAFYVLYALTVAFAKREVD